MAFSPRCRRNFHSQCKEKNLHWLLFYQLHRSDKLSKKMKNARWQTYGQLCKQVGQSCGKKKSKMPLLTLEIKIGRWTWKFISCNKVMTRRERPNHKPAGKTSISAHTKLPLNWMKPENKILLRYKNTDSKQQTWKIYAKRFKMGKRWCGSFKRVTLNSKFLVIRLR